MPAVDNFKPNSTGLSSTLRKFTAVTPSDSADLATVCRAVYVGSSGDLEFISPEGDTIVLKGLSGGIWHPIRASRIKAGNTTATDIVVAE